MIVKIMALCTGTLWMFWNWCFKTTMPIPVTLYRNEKRLGVVSLIWLTLESTGWRALKLNMAFLKHPQLALIAESAQFPPNLCVAEIPPKHPDMCLCVFLIK